MFCLRAWERKGGQFWCEDFQRWCRGKGIDPRYASAGQIGATAVIERFILSWKSEWLRRIQVSFRLAAVRQQISLYLAGYNEYRPSQSLDGRTPHEVHFALNPANKRPRFEPRRRWPKHASCAAPYARVQREKVRRLDLVLQFHGGSRQLPIVELKQAA